MEQLSFEEPRVRPMSLAEWLALPDDEDGEWVDGWLVEEEMSSYLHELIVGWLIASLREWVVPRGGSVIGSDFKFVVSTRRGRKPDVAVFFPGSRPPIRSSHLERPPDIAVEIVSAARSDIRRDRVAKLTEYAAFGVPWYWLMDPVQRTLEVLELGPDGRYVLALVATGGQVQVPGAEGLTLDLSALWVEVDAHDPQG